MSDSGELRDVAELESDYSESANELDSDADLTAEPRSVFKQFHVLFFELCYGGLLPYW